MGKKTTDLFDDVSSASEDHMDLSEPLLPSSTTPTVGTTETTAIVEGNTKSSNDKPAGGSLSKQAKKPEEKVPLSPAAAFKVLVVCGVGGVGMVSYGLSMAAIHTTLIYVAGALGLAVAPVAMVSEAVLAKSETLRSMVQKMRGEVSRMEEQNKLLSGNIDELEDHVHAAADVEKKLTNITQRQGVKVEEFVSLVRENGRIIKEMAAIVKGDTAQLLIRIVMAADTDGSFSISEDELKILVLRMSQVEFVTMDVQKFKKKVREDPSVGGVLQIVRNLLRDDLSEEDIIFKVNTDQMRKEKKSFS